MLHFISTNYSLKGDGAYKLGAVSQYFLLQSKEDVDFSAIAELQDGTPETRRRLAIYCAKVRKRVIFIFLYSNSNQDAYLPLALMNKLGSLENRVQVARSDCVPFPGLTKPNRLVQLAKTVSAAIHEGRVLPDPLQRMPR